jgi:AcrR family transcriptional regulator
LVVGALYRHFKDKEVLFEFFISPVLEVSKQLMDADSTNAYRHLHMATLDCIWNISEDTLNKFVRFAFQYKEELRLLLYCSQGSRHEHFIEAYVKKDLEGTLVFFNKVKEKGIPFHEIPKEDLFTLIRDEYHAVLEVAIQSRTTEQATARIRDLITFYTAGWKALINFDQ